MVLFLTPIKRSLPRLHKTAQTRKNLRSLLGLGLKFIPTPSLTNSWSRLKTSSYDRLFRSVHLRFHFAGKPPTKGQPPTIQSCMSVPNGHHHTGRFPPSHLRKASRNSPLPSTNYSKLVKAKQTYCLTNIEHYACCNSNKCS